MKTNLAKQTEYELVKKYLEDRGFELIEGRGEKNFQRDNIQVFNCPHMCNMVRVYRDFPELSDIELIRADREAYWDKADKRTIQKIPTSTMSISNIIRQLDAVLDKL